MSGTLRLRGATSGYSELQAPAVAADQTFVLPTAGGTLLTTDSPVPKLTLELGSASQPSLTFEGDTDTGLYSSGTNTLNLVTGGSNRLVIDSSGRLLIGTSSASGSYLVQSFGNSGSSTGSGGIIVGRATSSVGSASTLGSVYFNNTDSDTLSSITCFSDGTQTTNSSTPGAITLSTTASGASSPTERMRIDSSGRVGIGTSSPSTSLGAGGLHVTDRIAVGSGSNGTPALHYDGDTDTGFTFATARIGFVTGASERMRIDSSGRLLVGTTSSVNVGATIGSLIQVEHNSGTDAGLSVVCATNTGGGALVNLANKHSGTACSAGDDLGRIGFAGHDGTDLTNRGAQIFAEADDNWANNDTPGRLVFSTTADGASSPTERMRIDSSGNVGIGTTSNLLANSTRTTLSLNDTGSAAVALGVNGTREGHIYADANSMEVSAADNYMYFTAGSSERMRIDSSGNVGIGTTSPSTPLHVKGSDDCYFTIQTGVSAGDAGILFDNSVGTQVGWIIYDTDDNRLRFGTDNTERLRIDSSGRLLVGTTSAISGSSTNDNLQLVNSAGSILSVASSDTTISNGTRIGEIEFWGQPGSTWGNFATISCFGDATAASNDNPGRLVFSTTADGASSPTERMRIDNDGDVSIATTTNPGSLRVNVDNGYTNSGNTFHVIGGNTTGLYVGAHYDGGGGGCDFVSRGYSGGLGDFRFIGINGSYSSPSERMRISTTGKLTVLGVYSGTTTGGSAVYVESDGDILRYTSSLKYKTDIETLEDARADAILNCRPVWYRSKCENDIKTEGSEKSDWGWYGFIAEEVAEIEPRLVNWATKDAVTQEDGSVKSVERDPADYEAEGVRYDNFVPLLLNLVKRQKQAIETLEQRLTDAGL